MNALNLLSRAAIAIVVGALINAGALAQVVTDNFDSGSLAAGWKTSNFNPALVNTSFPDDGMGKGFRIQSNPFPSAGAPAAAMFYRDEVYTNFYMALDVVSWPGTDKNQAIVMVARGALSANPATTTGVILNYDASQYGENATDRRQGQFQINLVTNSPAFGTKTLAVSEVTLEPGRPYRFIFTGVGSLYIGRIYDFQDLTTPLVTIHADDVVQGAQGSGLIFEDGFKSGKCGFLSFSRQGTSGTTDVTIDNFYCGPTDPNAAVVGTTALPHPVAGTPVVTARTPSERFKNFHDPAQGISFTAQTFTADQVDASKTKLILNGADVSGQLTLSASGSTITGSLGGSSLAANTIYNAAIIVSDSTGSKKSTNTFWFDTFSDGYLKNSALRKIEAEDFNFDAGSYLADPIPVSGVDTNGVQVNGQGVGYYGQGGIEGIDFHDARTSAESPWGGEYRGVPVGLSQGMYPEVQDVNEPADAPLRRSDNVRSQYAVSNLLEFVVHRTEPGEWLNYTRKFAKGNYKAYLRVASFGASAVELHQVTSDRTVADQTTSKLGTFTIPNMFTRYNYRYIPLLDAGGSPVTVTLDGEQTLRLQMAGTAGQDARKLALNYLLLVPQAVTGAGATLFDDFNDGNDTGTVAWNHFDPIGNLTAAPAQFTFPSGAYRIVSPAPDIPDAGPARAGSFVKNADYSDFYVSVDVIDFDDTVRQAFGLAARITTPGLGTTGGYLFSWEPGSGTLPTATGGDFDISRIENEAPTQQIETGPSSLHLTRGKSYRFVFMGHGSDFEGQVYELPDTVTPLIRIPGHDSKEMFMSGQVGLIVADQGSGDLNKGDATFDNFLATTVEPRISIAHGGSGVTLTFPNTGFRLQSTSAIGVGAVWNDVPDVTAAGDNNTYSTATAATTFYRLIYP